MSWSVHLGLAASHVLTPGPGPITLLRCLASARNATTDICFVALDLKLVALEMRLKHISMRGIIRCCHELRCCHRCVPLCGLIRSSWTDASARTCVSVIRHVSHVGIADMSFTRSDPVGAVLPASDLIVVSILTHADDDFLLTCGTVTRNVVTWSSASGATAAVLLRRDFAVTGFPSATSRSFSLVLLWDLVRPVSLSSRNTFSDRHLSLSRTIRSLRPCRLCPCPCSSAAHRSALLSAYCCVLVISRISFRIYIQLAILVLARMRCASTRPSSILSTFTSVMMSSITVSDD